MIVTYTSAIERSGLTFTRVMLGNPVRRGSCRSRMMISASSRWIVLPSISVLRDIALQKLDLVIHQIHVSHGLHKIHQLAQRAFDIAALVAHHRDAQDRAAMLVQGAD